MSLSDEERRVIVELELERTDRIMQQLPTLITQQYWDTAANRMYYAAFHAVSALLIYNAIQVRTHKGSIVVFNKEFVRTGVFSEEEGKLYAQLEGLRERGDYNCFIDASEQEVVPLLKPLHAFIDKIKGLIVK